MQYIPIIFLLYVPLLNAQSCQEDHFHSVMGKGQIPATWPISDTLRIVLHDTPPPAQWWDTSNTKEKNGQKTLSNAKTKGKNRTDQRLVEIINPGKKSIFIEKPDRMLMMCMQAKDPQNEWRDVAVLFKGVCGMSSQSKFNDTLRSRERWLTFIEKYRGDRKTQYRVKLMIKLDGTDTYFYSNAIDGDIDDCRFVRVGQ